MQSDYGDETAMTPAYFPEANVKFGPPEGMAESQIMSIPVAWLPSAEEMKDMQQGKPIYLTMIGGLAPHYLTTDFKQATSPA